MSSIIVSSTTDTQEQVNEAAGITSGKPKDVPSEAPETDGEPESDGDPETPEEEPDQENQAEDRPKRKWTAEHRINRLVREKHQLAGRVQELERQLTSSRPEGTPPQQAAPQGEPQESEFQRYEDYVRALARWEATQAQQAAIEHYQRQEAQRQYLEAQQRQQVEWEGRLGSFRRSTPDFDDVLESSADIILPPSVQQAILEHENGPQLAYELAKDHDELARIASLSPTAALRALGRFEARLTNLNGHQPTPAVSKAPPPIRPVGQGTTRSTKTPEDMDYQEFKRWRLKNGAR